MLQTTTDRQGSPAWPRIPEAAHVCDTPANTPSRANKALGLQLGTRRLHKGKTLADSVLLSVLLSTHKALDPNTPARPGHQQSPEMLSHRFQPSHLQKLLTASAQHFSTLTPDTFPLHRPRKAEGSTATGKAQKLLQLIAHPWNSPLNRLTQRKAIM